MPTGIQKISSEWTVAYGNQVNNKPPPAKKR